MKTTHRVAALVIAIALNAAAFGALHIAMLDGAERAVLANHELDHVVVSATRAPAELAKGACPGPKAL